MGVDSRGYGIAQEQSGYVVAKASIGKDIGGIWLAGSK